MKALLWIACSLLGIGSIRALESPPAPLLIDAAITPCLPGPPPRVHSREPVQKWGPADHRTVS